MMITYPTSSNATSERQRIAQNISDLRERIALAAQASGRSAACVRLVAVSKTVGSAQIEAALAAGVSDFGENRSQLFSERQEAYPEAAWHFIGRIQTNKIKLFTGRAALVHSVASERVLRGIAAAAEKLDGVQPVLIEVNCSGEMSKDGVQAAELPRILELAATMPGIKIDGLMTMAPQGEPVLARRCFVELRNLRAQMSERYASESRLGLTELSMGMSEDFIAAIEEGATIVRVGRAVWL
jgi:pyridoxal phosphate enzyme (YggS family)